MKVGNGEGEKKGRRKGARRGEEEKEMGNRKREGEGKSLEVRRRWERCWTGFGVRQTAWGWGGGGL